MKRIRDFAAPTNPTAAQRLREQLGQFEQNVSDEFVLVEQAKMARLRVKKRITNSNSESVGPGQSIGITYTVSRIQLDVPGARDAGKFLAICKGYGVATNTEIIAPSGSLINGQPTMTLGNSTLLLLVYCDGVDYWAYIP